MPHKDIETRREYQRQYQKMWRKLNPDKVYENQHNHDQKRKSTSKRIKQVSDHRIRRHARQRILVLEKYGQCKCSFCGDSRYEVLTIDHINGGGMAHRESWRGQYRNMYDLLARTEFRPDLYRVLCWNCHMAMTRYDIKPGEKDYMPIEWWKEFSKSKYSLRKKQ